MQAAVGSCILSLEPTVNPDDLKLSVSSYYIVADMSDIMSCSCLKAYFVKTPLRVCIYIYTHITGLLVYLPI